jgi:hypothetical protein
MKMNTNLMACGLDDERIRFEPDNLDRAKLVEEYADNLMAECKDFNAAERINRGHDLFDGDLLTDLMVEIAQWNGSQYYGEHNAAVQMRKLYNMLANALQTIAEKEVK